MKIKILLAAPRGYCAWVHRAINIVEQAIVSYWTPLYVNHEIIHNKFIIEHFKYKWVIFWKDPEEISQGGIIVFSAHWVWPEFIKRVRNSKLQFIDASCPLVIKVHNEAKKFLESGYDIIYVWKKWHQEADGILEEAADRIHIVSKIDDVEKILVYWESKKYALLTQTTLSVQETQELIKKIQILIPNIILPVKEDICYATTNRQMAVTEIAKKSNMLIIVGSKNSSNSTKLKKIGDTHGIKTLQIDSYTELIEQVWVSFLNKIEEGICTIWISWWASAPEHLIQEVVDYCKTLWDVEIEEVKVAQEKMIFPFNIELQK